MAQRRMFNKTITNSSRFLMMPQSAQNLYFHFGMNADDDGFCEHFTVMRMTESKPDDLKILHSKGFVKVFDDKVLVILDWKENNYIQKDRYTPSKYLETYKKELAQISDKSNEVDKCIQNVYKTDTQVRLGKVRLGKDIIVSIEEKTKIFINEVKELFKDQKLTPIQVEELKKFVSYWTEPNKSKTKLRWELEKTWDLKRRIGTWMKNYEKFNGGQNNKYQVGKV